MSETAAGTGFDLAVRVTLPTAWTEVAGALLMDVLGPFVEESGGRASTLVFFPGPAVECTREAVLDLLPPSLKQGEDVAVEIVAVPRDWEDNWRQYFRPIAVGRVRIRPPWEAAVDAGTDLNHHAATPAPTSAVEVVINPGLGFGTGLHPTTRGVLLLLQEEEAPASAGGPLVDVGTGSGILAIAAAKLGWSPVLAFDNDPQALAAARANVRTNAVAVEVAEADVATACLAWFAHATVLANLTLEPVVVLLWRLGAGAVPVVRLLVSGILAGEQEAKVLREAAAAGFLLGRRLQEDEWCSLELLPRACSQE